MSESPVYRAADTQDQMHIWKMFACVVVHIAECILSATSAHSMSSLCKTYPYDGYKARVIHTQTQLRDAYKHIRNKVVLFRSIPHHVVYLFLVWCDARFVGLMGQSARV